MQVLPSKSLPPRNASSDSARPCEFSPLFTSAYARPYRPPQPRRGAGGSPNCYHVAGGFQQSQTGSGTSPRIDSRCMHTGPVKDTNKWFGETLRVLLAFSSWLMPDLTAHPSPGPRIGAGGSPNCYHVAGRFQQSQTGLGTSPRIDSRCMHTGPVKDTNKWFGNTLRVLLAFSRRLMPDLTAHPSPGPRMGAGGSPNCYHVAGGLQQSRTGSGTSPRIDSRCMHTGPVKDTKVVKKTNINIATAAQFTTCSLVLPCSRRATSCRHY